MWGDRVLRSELRDVPESAGRTCLVLADFREIIETAEERENSPRGCSYSHSDPILSEFSTNHPPRG